MANKNEDTVFEVFYPGHRQPGDQLKITRTEQVWTFFEPYGGKRTVKKKLRTSPLAAFITAMGIK